MGMMTRIGTAIVTASLLVGSQITVLAQATQPSRLINAWTSQGAVRVWSATYYFTLEVGTNTTKPVETVVLNQHDGIDTIEFRTEESEVFSGDRSNPGPRLPLKSIVADRTTRTVTIVFDQPVPPGQRFTIALNPVYNPDTAGIYLFGVTIFPLDGQKIDKQNRGLFLGYGRLHFYDGGGSDHLFRWR